MTPAHPARLALVAAGSTNRRFAEWAGLHEKYVSDVLNSRYPASPRFRRLLAAYLSQSETTLFGPIPGEREAGVSMVAPERTDLEQSAV